MDTIDTNTLVSLITDATSAETAIKDAQLAYEAKLAAIVVANRSSTFCHNGQWFQIRTRKSEEESRTITYLCRLKAEPKTWLKGRPKGVSSKKSPASLGDESSMSMMNAALSTLGDDAAPLETTTVIE